MRAAWQLPCRLNNPPASRNSTSAPNVKPSRMVAVLVKPAGGKAAKTLCMTKWSPSAPQGAKNGVCLSQVLSDIGSKGFSGAHWDVKPIPMHPCRNCL